MKNEIEAFRNRFESLRPQIERGIEENRKRDLTVVVKGKDGQAIPDANIKISQTTHGFRFGCNALKWGQLGELNERYGEEFTRLFNLVTTTCCWSITETKPGIFRFSDSDGDMPRRPPIDRMVHFARERNIALKCQPLLADSWTPEWSAKNPEVFRAQWIEFVRKMAQKYAGVVDVWDVVNEAFLCKGRSPDYPLYTDDLTYIDWAFEQAQNVFPKDHGIFELNEYSGVNWGNEAQRYFEICERLLKKKLPLESIGFQFHAFSVEDGKRLVAGEAFPLNEIYETYQRFDTLGVPLSITEITVPSRFPGLNAAEGEKLQAEVLSDLYRLWFSIKNMRSIIYWNFMDGAHWRSEGDCLGCLMDVNCREKPSYQALYQLFEREWKTNETGKTNANGKISVRGFTGDYDVTVVINGLSKTIHHVLSENEGSELNITMP